MIATVPAPATSGPGRPGKRLALEAGAGHAAGIEFGHSYIQVAVSDLNRDILAARTQSAVVHGNADEALHTAASLLRDALTSAGVGMDTIFGVGVTVPGPVDTLRAKSEPPTIVPGWEGACVVDALHAELDVPVYVDHDIPVGVLASSVFGAGKDVDTFAYVDIGSGIGVGLVLDGRLFRGWNGSAGELGHVRVSEYGPFCYCGNRGCLQAIASGNAIVDALRPTFGPDLDLAQVLDRAQDGDVACRRAIEDAAAAIGNALANLCNIINPQRLIIGGQVSWVGDLLLDPIRTAVHRRTIQTASDVDIVRSPLDGNETILGALSLVPVDPEMLVRRYVAVDWPDRGISRTAPPHRKSNGPEPMDRRVADLGPTAPIRSRS